jgi:hypothetical protein
MPPKAELNIDPVLWTAIEERRLVRFRYKGKERVLEPHDYGIHNGVVKLLGYQVGGSSSHKLPSWRWFETALISDPQLLNRIFPGGRPAPSGRHHKWEQLFIRVQSADDNRQ